MSLVDARQMYGNRIRVPEDLVAHARAHARRRAEHGRPPFENSDLSDPAPSGEVCAAYVNEGRWVADCPTCNGGVAVLLGHSQMVCLDCGYAAEVTFPSEQEMSDAAAVLGHRPKMNRNWRPDRESVQDLQAENAVRGLKFARRIG